MAERALPSGVMGPCDFAPLIVNCSERVNLSGDMIMCTWLYHKWWNLLGWWFVGGVGDGVGRVRLADFAGYGRVVNSGEGL
jgi:hypothetical protein